MSEYFLGRRGSEIPMLQETRKVEVRYINHGQISNMGEGVSKTAKKIPTSFMDGS